MTVESARGSPRPAFSKRYLLALLYAGGLILVGYFSYLYGWYTGFVFETITSNIDHGRVHLMTAKAIRDGDVARALWMQDLAVEGCLNGLSRLAEMVPEQYESAHRGILRDMTRYRTEYPDSDKGTRIEDFEVAK